MATGGREYLLTGRVTELERVKAVALGWEDAGRTLLAQIPAPESGVRALDVACGPLGWLRVLSEWAGPDGEVVGADVDERFVDAATSFARDEGLSNVTVREDDLFRSSLPSASFDLVHSRFTLAPLGRLREQLGTLTRLVRPGGWIIVEEPDSSSWHLHPNGPAFDQLVELVVRAFKAAGGDFDVGRKLPSLLRSVGVKPQISAHVRALPASDPHIRTALQLIASLEPRLVELTSENDVQKLRRAVENELADPNRWGTTLLLVQAWGRFAG